jgi:hypothetical protein
MTNEEFLTQDDEEKTLEIALEFTLQCTTRCTYEEVREAVELMASYKNNQFKTELERMMNRFHGEESHKAYFSLETLQELYDNLFKNVIEQL